MTSRIVSQILTACIAVTFLPAIPASGQNLFYGSIGFPQPKGYLLTSDLDGGGPTNIMPPQPDPAGPVSVDVDPAIRTVFFTDILAGGSMGQLRSVKFDGSSPTLVASWPGANEPYGLAADTVNKRLYWAESGATGSVVRRSNYDGSAANAILTTNGTTIEAIEVDPAAGLVFWVDYETVAQGVAMGGVHRANLDGTSPQTLVTLAAPSLLPSGITVDPVTQTVYWSEYFAGTISTVSYNGGITSILKSGLTEPAGLDLELSIGRLYVVQKGLATVGWTSPAGVGFTTVFSPPPLGEMWDVAVIVGVPEPSSLTLLIAVAAVVLPLRKQR